MPKWSDFLVKPTKYSNYDISTTKRGSVSPGMLIPVWYQLMNPGETFRINIRSLIRTNPTLAPLMGRFKVRVVTAVSNIKNYAVGLEGYRRSFDWRTFNLPKLRVVFNNSTNNASQADYYIRNTQVKETSLADYLGYQVGWFPSSQQYPDATPLDSPYQYLSYIEKNALPFLIYYDFYRNYLVNPQEGYFPMFVALHKGNGVYSDPVQTYVRMGSLTMLDTMFEDIHKAYDGTNDINLSTLSVGKTWNDLFGWLFCNSYVVNGAPTRATTWSTYHGGLVGTMFDPDINTEWLSTNNFARLQNVRVNTQGSSASEGGVYTNYEDIVKASSIWEFISREIYSGGTYADHIYSQFGVSVKSDMNIPQIVHVYDSMVDFEDITSQSETEGARVGEQFGVGRGYGQSSRFTIRNKDNNYCYVMSFMWITPLVDYSCGLPEDSNILSFKDLYTPAFDNYSMQPRFLENVNASVVKNSSGYVDDTFANPMDRVVGYQPAWSEYKTALNRVHGLFANQLSYWAILRKYPTLGSTIRDYTGLSSYVYASPVGVGYSEEDAQQYYVPFSVTNEDNFFYQMRFDVVATRPMSKSVMPHVK